MKQTTQKAVKAENKFTLLYPAGQTLTGKLGYLKAAFRNFVDNILEMEFSRLDLETLIYAQWEKSYKTYGKLSPATLRRAVRERIIGAECLKPDPAKGWITTKSLAGANITEMRHICLYFDDTLYSYVDRWLGDYHQLQIIARLQNVGLYINPKKTVLVKDTDHLSITHLGIVVERDMLKLTPIKLTKVKEIY